MRIGTLDGLGDLEPGGAQRAGLGLSVEALGTVGDGVGLHLDDDRVETGLPVLVEVGGGAVALLVVRGGVVGTAGDLLMAVDPQPGHRVVGEPGGRQVDDAGIDGRIEVELIAVVPVSPRLVLPSGHGLIVRVPLVDGGELGADPVGVLVGRGDPAARHLPDLGGMPCGVRWRQGDSRAGAVRPAIALSGIGVVGHLPVVVVRVVAENLRPVPSGVDEGLVGGAVHGRDGGGGVRLRSLMEVDRTGADQCRRAHEQSQQTGRGPRRGRVRATSSRMDRGSGTTHHE